MSLIKCYSDEAATLILEVLEHLGYKIQEVIDIADDKPIEIIFTGVQEDKKKITSKTGALNGAAKKRRKSDGDGDDLGGRGVKVPDAIEKAARALSKAAVASYDN